MTESPRRGRPPVLLDGRTVPERLVEAARDLFAEKGYESTSVQDVVERAGVTKGAMYHYYRSKEELLAETYARVLDRQLARLQAIVAGDDPVPQRLARAAADVVVSTVEELPGSTILLGSLHQLGERHRREVYAQRRRYRALLLGLVQEGAEAGVLRDDVDLDVAVDYFLGAVHHLVVWWRPERGPSPDEVGETFARLLLDSLRPGPAPLVTNDVLDRSKRSGDRHG